MVMVVWVRFKSCWRLHCYHNCCWQISATRQAGVWPKLIRPFPAAEKRRTTNEKHWTKLRLGVFRFSANEQIPLPSYCWNLNWIAMINHHLVIVRLLFGGEVCQYWIGWELHFSCSNRGPKDVQRTRVGHRKRVNYGNPTKNARM